MAENVKALKGKSKGGKGEGETPKGKGKGGEPKGKGKGKTKSSSLSPMALFPTSLNRLGLSFVAHDEDVNVMLSPGTFGEASDISLIALMWAIQPCRRATR